MRFIKAITKTAAPPRQLTRSELEFLPAALEIVETPPSPLGKITARLIIALFITALGWAVVGHLDEIAVAPGKVIPSGYTKTIQTEDKGVVKAIYVKDGSKVQAGDPLLELDMTVTAADLSRAQADRQRVAMQLDIAAEKERKMRALAHSGAVATFVYQDYLERYLALQQELAVKDAEVSKANHALLQSRITAPITGTVHRLAVHTVGAVAAPGQILLMLVPDGAQMEIEAWIPNKDIGFVCEGQAAEIKVETFNFQKYGTLKAVVSEISSDAVEDKEKGGLVYRAILRTEQSSFDMANGRTAYLTPGMAVLAEIKTRQKRVIDYFLDPFIKYKSEGLRER